MIRLLFVILSISLVAMVVFPNGVYAMENSQIMSCCKKVKQHHDCCSKKDRDKHHSSGKKDTHKSCEKKSSACLCIGGVSTVAITNQEINDDENVSILLPQKYMLINDKKPSLIYLSIWLLPKING